jgi:hypothetical protein
MRFCLLLVAASVIALVACPATQATPTIAAQFKKDFTDKLEDKKFAEELNKAPNKCFVCHQGKSRKNRNSLGHELSKLIKKDQKDPEKISDALKKVMDMHTDPKDEKSQTYLDRLKASKWPAGDLEELKKDPKGEATKDGAAK